MQQQFYKCWDNTITGSNNVTTEMAFTAKGIISRVIFVFLTLVR